MSHVNYSDNTSLDATILSNQFQFQFRSASVVRAALTDRFIVNGGGLGRSVSFARFSGIDASTTALTPGADFSYTDPTDASTSATIKPYAHSIRVDGLTESVTPGDLLSQFADDLVGWGGEQLDLLGFTALAAGTNQTIVGQSAVTSLTSTDTITTATIRKAVATLEAAKAPKIMTPVGPRYVGGIHPHVKYDLFGESSGEFKTALMNVNAPEWSLYACGDNLGVLWFETPCAALAGSDDGYGAVDAYYTPIVGAGGLGLAFAPVLPPPPGVFEIPVLPNRAIVARTVAPLTNGGYYRDAHCIAQVGFAIANQNAVNVVCSASSLGTNT